MFADIFPKRGQIQALFNFEVNQHCSLLSSFVTIYFQNNGRC